MSLLACTGNYVITLQDCCKTLIFGGKLFDKNGFYSRGFASKPEHWPDTSSVILSLPFCARGDVGISWLMSPGSSSSGKSSCQPIDWQLVQGLALADPHFNWGRLISIVRLRRGAYALNACSSMAGHMGLGQVRWKMEKHLWLPQKTILRIKGPAVTKATWNESYWLKGNGQALWKIWGSFHTENLRYRPEEFIWTLLS